MLPPPKILLFLLKHPVYLVVLTVHVHNNDIVKLLRRMYAVFLTSRHGITSQKASTSNNTAAGTLYLVFSVWKFLQPCVSVQYECALKSSRPNNEKTNL